MPSSSQEKEGGIIINRNIITNTITVKKNKKKIERFYVQKKNISSKPFELRLQAIRFNNGTILVGYDVWRILQHDCSSDPNPIWFHDIESLKENYEIRAINDFINC